MDDLDTFELIERYLEGQMDEAAQKQFEAQIQQDPALQAQLKDQLKLQYASWTSMKAEYAEKFGLWKEEVAKDKRMFLGRDQRIWSLAAVVLMLILIFVWWGPFQTAGMDMQDFYAMHMGPVSISENRSFDPADTNNQEIWEQALADYEQEAYAKAAGGFESLLDQAPDSLWVDQFHLLLGNCYLFEKKALLALKIFQNVNPQSESYYEAKWQMGLCYLFLEDKENARALFQEIQGLPDFPTQKKEHAVEILKNLPQ